jgi:iron uptake system EfeUOB component EfeO/EfeM
MGGQVGIDINMPSRMLLALLIAAPLVAGCGKSDEEEAAERARAYGDSVAAERAAGKTDLANPDMGAKVSIVLTEWEIKQTSEQIPQGQVTFVVENHGKMPHEFEIASEKQRWNSGVIQPGAHVFMTMILDPGVYNIFSPSKDSTGTTHADKGMKSLLAVAARPNASGPVSTAPAPTTTTN